METEDFNINYVHAGPTIGNRFCPVAGYFEVTLGGQKIPNQKGRYDHDTDYTFEPDQILDCAIMVGMGKEERLQFNPERRRFALKFSPLEKGMVEVSEETTPGLRVRIPKRDITGKLIGCYRNVCSQKKYSDPPAKSKFL